MCDAPDFVGGALTHTQKYIYIYIYIYITQKYIYIYIYIITHTHTYIQEIDLDTFDGFVLECVLLIECIFLLQEFDLDAFDAFCVLVANTECDTGSGRTHSTKLDVSTRPGAVGDWDISGDVGSRTKLVDLEEDTDSE
jgi:hypothetical protein